LCHLDRVSDADFPDFSSGIGIWERCTGDRIGKTHIKTAFRIQKVKCITVPNADLKKSRCTMAIDSGATAWILASTALVMIMTPGVGFFYGGLVRRKNFISMITLSFVAFALVSIQWVLFGYSLAFGSDVGGFIGNLQYLGLNNVGMEPGPFSTAIPGLLYMVFQLVFATVTMAIVTSGFAERIKFSAYLVFALVWTTIVYDPLAHWVWGG